MSMEVGIGGRLRDSRKQQGKTCMLAAQRRELMIDRLRTDGQLNARELAAELAVSEDSVRRDLRELAAAGLRVQLARRFHNDVVRSARVVRRKRVVRYLRLAGHAPWPQTFEISDTPPETLAAGAVTSDAYRRST
jgi:hypothetical protein